MDAAEALKDEGNAAFADGDDAVAAARYEQAISLLESPSACHATGASQAHKDLRRNLYSNLSNVYLSQRRFEESCRAASRALEIDPTFVKASLRLVKAKMLAGFSFDAFVYALRHTRALVRGLPHGSTAAKDAAKALSELESQLSALLGVSRLSHGFELVEFEGGVDMISRRHFVPGDVIFAEEKYKTPFEEGGIEATSGDTAGATTESIVLRFAEHIRAEQKVQSLQWQTFKRDFVGAWPRTVDDVDAFTRQHVGDYIRPHFPDLDAASFEELLLVSLMCRYNCFYTGFFRTCALANHSCDANIAMKYNPSTQTVTMVAVKDIVPGERMNVKYLNDAYFLLGVCKRRELLRAWLFWCRCPRCQEDNNAATAVQESVGCERCGRFTHYPIPPLTREGVAGDPIVAADPVCAHCGQGIAWSEEKLQAFYMLTGNPPSGIVAQETGRWLVDKLTAAQQLKLHPAHWIYRVLLYLFCHTLDTVIQHRFGLIMQGWGGAASREEEARDILHSFGLQAACEPFLSRVAAEPACFGLSNGSESACRDRAGYNPAGIVADTLLVNTSAATHGSDTLRALCILIDLIKPFYPRSEMWALHRMVCECVMLHVLFQRSLLLPEDQLLSTEQAMALLQEHGAFLGEHAAARWLHCFSLLRSSIGKEDERELPAVASLRKALKAHPRRP